MSCVALQTVGEEIDTGLSRSFAPRQNRVILLNAFKAAQDEAAINGTNNMTMEEIDEIIADCRRDYFFHNGIAI